MLRLENGLIIDVECEDLVDFYADAIVVPNNTALNQDSDLMRRLAKKAGKSTLDAAKANAPLPLGEAIVTIGGGLLATFIVHLAIVSTDPLQNRETMDRRDLLKFAVKNAILRCAEIEIESVGIPNIGEPLDLGPKESARLMLASLAEVELPSGDALKKVFCLLKNVEEADQFARIATAVSI